MTMLLRFLCHMALMLFLSGSNYGDQATVVEGSQSTDKSVTERVANNVINDVKQQADDEDILEQDIQKLENGIGSSEETQDSSEEDGALALFNCSLPANLDRYCTDINKEEHAYFNLKVSVAGLLVSLFRSDIVKALLDNCSPGSWCLPDRYHQELMQEKSIFYSVNPVCSERVWECMVIMLDERTGCGEKDLKFLVDSTYLLCNLKDGDVLGLECYARSLEALYVTFVGDFINVANSQRTGSTKTDCNGYKAQMTKTYIRAIDACGTYQKSLLNNFDSWADVIQNVRSTAAKCNISYQNEISSTSSYDNETAVEEEDLGELLQEIVNKIEETEGTESGTQDGLNENTDGAQHTDNQAVVVVAVVLTTVMVAGFLGLALLSYRRCRARCGYDKLGYSKLGAEEAALLRGEFT